MLEQGLLFGTGGQGERSPADRSAAEEQSQAHRARLGAIVANGNEDFPHGGVGGGAAQSDFPQAAVLGGVGDGQDAQVGHAGGGEGGGIGFRNASGTYENDLAGAARAEGLNLAGEFEGLLQIQGSGAGLRTGDGILDLRAIGFKAGGRSG